MSIKDNIRYSWPLHICIKITNLLPDNVFFLRFRGWICHYFLGSCGKNFRLGRNTVFYNPQDIHIGKNCYIAYGNWFSAGKNSSITLEDEVVLGPYTIIVSSNHTRINGSFRYGNPKCAPVHIGRGVWIGGNCLITAGRIIGQGSAVGGGSVVTHDVPPNCLFAGNPGKKIKTFENE